MGDISRVKIVNEGEKFIKTKCYIDNQKIEFIKAIDFHFSFDEIPTFDFEVMGMPDIDMLADVQFSFTPNTVDEAVKVLRNELLKKGDIYKGFLSSMESTVREQQLTLPYRAPIWIAEDILKRIIGEE